MKIAILVALVFVLSTAMAFFLCYCSGISFGTDAFGYILVLFWLMGACLFIPIYLDTGRNKY